MFRAAFSRQKSPRLIEVGQIENPATKILHRRKSATSPSCKLSAMRPKFALTPAPTPSDHCKMVRSNRERETLSYDLLLLSELGERMRKQVYDFFAARPNYEVSSDDIMYENPETGVHFQWVFIQFHRDELNEESEPLHEHEIGHLRLNFYRPTAFANEAAIELLALSQALPVKFYDLPQDLIYESFTETTQLTIPYIEHAQKAVSALRTSDEGVAMAEEQPKRALDAVWEWNFNRDAFTDGLGEDLFVPKIDFFRFDGELRTGVVWGDAVPMLCPYVDIVVLYRDETAPTTGWFRRKKSRVDVLQFEEFKEIYGDWFSPDSRARKSVSCSPSDAISLFTAVASKPIRREASLQGDRSKLSLEMVPFMAVLDSEICIPTSSEGVSLITKSIEDQEGTN